MRGAACSQFGHANGLEVVGAGIDGGRLDDKRSMQACMDVYA